MNSTYVPDNTKSSMVIVLSLALAVGLIAALLGLSEKPDIQILAVSFDPAASPVTSDSSLPAADPADPTNASTAVEFDELGQPITDGDTTANTSAADAPSAEPEAAALPLDDSVDEPQTSVPAPTSAPEPTPEVAAAVEPTPIPSVAPTPEPTSQRPADAAAADTGAVGSGTVEGAFFTRPDEDAGATVAQNLVQVSFNDDGSGMFRGVLDITYADETRVYLEMTGQLVWTSGNPQVVANVTGTYGFDSLVNADDVASTEGELSITSLKSGSGSLCTPKCFGFTFPPQNRL